MNLRIQWVAFSTIVSREVERFIRIWKQTLLPPVITQSLYFIVFGGFVGSQVRDIGGVSYMAFIVPGLVMMTVITSAFTNVSFSFYIAKFQRSIEEILVAPIRPSVMLAGFIAGGVIRALATGAIVFLVSFIFVRPSVHNMLIMLVFATMTALIFSLAGFINGVYANSFDDVGTFPTFVLTPLTYLGGVFYPIAGLPGFWQTVSRFNPIVYMVDGFRSGITGLQEFPLTLSFAILLAVFAALFAGCVVILRRGAGLKN